ncbi:hypothetical protein [Marinobacter sp. CP1]|uniref:hypothetical protein n=1 Tax=Marinobacter sp. CP1 TaxID=1671721 RepID=UPI00130EBAA1|nr:hypothetical protein [Marinobacter sp. CP1]
MATLVWNTQKGTDIPRLQLCCRLSRIRTEFHQSVRRRNSTSTFFGLPDLIDSFTAIERFRSAFHDSDYLSLTILGVDTTRHYIEGVVLNAAGCHSLGITEYRKIGVVCGKDELLPWFYCAQQLYDFLIDSLAIEVILWLIYKEKVIVVLAEQEQHHRRSSLS